MPEMSQVNRGRDFDMLQTSSLQITTGFNNKKNSSITLASQLKDASQHVFRIVLTSTLLMWRLPAEWPLELMGRHMLHAHRTQLQIIQGSMSNSRLRFCVTSLCPLSANICHFLARQYSAASLITRHVPYWAYMGRSGSPSLRISLITAQLLWRNLTTLL